MTPQRRRSRWERLRRWVHYKLMIPIKRSHHPPEHTARGSMIGLAWAFTPTIGLQMLFVITTWIVARRLFRWDFNVIVGVAWTWTTNALTMLPSYYAFYVTGQMMLGQWHDLAGYQSFLTLWQSTAGAMGEDANLAETATLYGEVLLGWGVAMLVGCIPWAALVGWVGYAWTLRFVRSYQEGRARRRHAAAVARAALRAERVDFATPAQ